MAIKVKKSRNSEGSYKLFTGALNMKVVAVNPSQKELQEMGFKAEKVPVYSFEKEVTLADKSKQKVQNHMVKFFLEAEVGEDTAKAQVAFFINSTKQQVYIDRLGSFASDPSKLDPKNRQAFDGEINLMLFLAALCEHSKGEEFYLNSINRLASVGDVAELKDIVKQAFEMNNEVKVLLGVKDGKHQVVYDRKIERSWSNNLSYLWKDLMQNKGYYAGVEWGPIDELLFNPNDFKLREYVKDEQAALAEAPVSSNRTAGAAVDPFAGGQPSTAQGSFNPTNVNPPF